MVFDSVLKIQSNFVQSFWEYPDLVCLELKYVLHKSQCICEKLNLFYCPRTKFQNNGFCACHDNPVLECSFVIMQADYGEIPILCFERDYSKFTVKSRYM